MVTDQTSAHDTLNGYVPNGMPYEQALALRVSDPDEYARRAVASIVEHVTAMVALQRAGAQVFDYGNNIRGVALEAGYADAFSFEGFVPLYIRPLFCRGNGPFRWVALSGDPADIARTDRAVLEALPDNESVTRWMRMAPSKVRFQGLPARICWLEYGERARIGVLFNELVARGEVKAPIVIGRDHLDAGSVASPYRETEGMRDGSDAIADWPLLNAMLNVAAGASWVSIHHGGGVGIGKSIHAGMVVVADGTALMAERLQRVLTTDPGTGIMRHADAGYPEAIAAAREGGLDLPMVKEIALVKAAAGGAAPCDFVLRGAAELVTMSGTDGCGLVVDGALAAREGRIAWVGPERDLDRHVAVADDAVVVDAEGAAVLPGFVDPHTHAVFAGSRAGEYAERLAGRTYADILAGGGGINATVRATRAAAAEELAALTRRRLDSFLIHGTTTLEIKSGYGLTLATSARSWPRPPWSTQSAGCAPSWEHTPCPTSLPGGPTTTWSSSAARCCPPSAARPSSWTSSAMWVLSPSSSRGACCWRRADSATGSRSTPTSLRDREELGLPLSSAVSRPTISCTPPGRRSRPSSRLRWWPWRCPARASRSVQPYAPARAFLEAGLVLALATDFNPGTCYCENMQMVVALGCQEMRLTPGRGSAGRYAGSGGRHRPPGRGRQPRGGQVLRSARSRRRLAHGAALSLGRQPGARRGRRRPRGGLRRAMSCARDAGGAA